MTVTIVGSQLGDEGKGGIVDVYGDAADVVVRYQGGDNAGHTVVRDGQEYKLSLVPSGAVRGKTNVLGNGCVVNPGTLFEELDALRERGLDPDVRVARRAHVIFPYHRVLDGIEEEVKSETDSEVGTTGRGIGPTYEDKAGRRGIRAGELADPEILRDRLEYVVPQKRALAEEVFGVEAGEAFDLHGNYPYVTSSTPTAGGAAVGAGVGPAVVGDGEVVGVVKAYLSRVGSGPMPTELAGVEGDTPGYDGDGDPAEEELADHIREAGGEYGTVTGRPRRIGWLDVPMLRHAARASGVTGLAVNHVDTLAGLEEVKAGHAYDLDGETIETVPATTERWADCEPVFWSFDGWPDVDWAAVAETGYDAVPDNARAYLEYIADEAGAPIYAVGVGPDREETVVVEKPL
ncbi:adenylosuccinate synthase [Halobacteriales archaeon QS_9_70_65]|nr:MAG: adenylosuccinate synthase [Halobacteriales archaeon QS_9_70_65]